MSDNHQSSEKTLTINGQSVVAAAGETLLSVARRYGIRIPTLCHHQAVTPYAACRLCVVEVTWGTRSKLVTSCVYEPWDGDVVLTDSERVHASRRMILELQLARCPDAEAVRELAAEYGVTEPRFAGTKADPARCILCGLCVRVCRELVGQEAIGFAQRGNHRSVSAPLKREARDCIGCGACVYVCPTGALHLEDAGGERVLREWHTHLPLSNCRVCGTAFATAKQLQALGPRVPVPTELLETCPQCRRQITGEQTRAAQRCVGES